MTLIRELLQDIDREVPVVTSNTTVYESIKLMEEHDFGAVSIIDDNKLVGIFTERDYARKLLLQGMSSMTTYVKATMTAEVISISPDQSIEECLELMVNSHVRHLPVLDGEKLVGLVSMADLAKASIQKSHPS